LAAEHVKAASDYASRFSPRIAQSRAVEQPVAPPPPVIRTSNFFGETI